MILHTASHTDHVSADVLAYVVSRFADRDGFFIETVELPDHLSVQSGLYGPLAGDPPVAESEVEYAARNGRPYPSRMIHRPTRPTRELTVIAGPHDGHSCVLYTCFGGRPTPKEVGDVERNGTEAEVAASREFWSQHALAFGA